MFEREVDPLFLHPAALELPGERRRVAAAGKPEHELPGDVLEQRLLERAEHAGERREDLERAERLGVVTQWNRDRRAHAERSSSGAKARGTPMRSHR